MQVLGYGHIKILSNDVTILKWPIVYTPASNGMLLSSDNYCQLIEDTLTTVIKMLKSAKYGSTTFHQKINDILTTSKLQQTSNIE